MAVQLWSWIFIFQTLFIRLGYAHVHHNYEVLAGRALERVFMFVYFNLFILRIASNTYYHSRGLTKAEKERNTFIGLAIAGSVVLVAIVVGLFVLYLRQRVKIQDSESGGTAIPKPHWWMVESKSEKLWRRLSQPSSPEAGSRIERLREVLNIQRKEKKGPILPTHRPSVPSPTDSLDLPMQTDPNIRPDYPESLERSYNAPIYSVQSPPRIPKVVTTMYDGGRHIKRISPTVPPRAIVTQGQRTTLSRSGARSGGPRSPAGRRWLARNSFRNPFLPLKDSDAPLTISAPTPANIDPKNPKLNYSGTMTNPRTATTPAQARDLTNPAANAVPRKPVIPAPLQLQGRVGLPGSPRPSGLPASPRPPRPTTPAI